MKLDENLLATSAEVTAAIAAGDSVGAVSDVLERLEKLVLDRTGLTPTTGLPSTGPSFRELPAMRQEPYFVQDKPLSDGLTAHFRIHRQSAHASEVAQGVTNQAKVLVGEWHECWVARQGSGLEKQEITLLRVTEQIADEEGNDLVVEYDENGVRIAGSGPQVLSIEKVVFKIPENGKHSTTSTVTTLMGGLPSSGQGVAPEANGAIFLRPAEIGVKVSLLPVEFKKLYERDNPVNFVHDTTNKTELDPTPKNVLYVVANGQGKANIVLDLEQQPQIEGLKWAVVRNGFNRIVVQGEIPSNGSPIEMELEEPFFALTEPDADDGWEVHVGYDTNDDGDLDEAEGFPLTIAGLSREKVKVHLIAKRKYFEADTMIAAGTAFGGLIGQKFATELLKIFYTGNENAPDLEWRPNSTATISFNCFSSHFSEWLTHNSGEAFNATGTAPQLKHCVWNNVPKTNEAIANDSLVTDMIHAVYLQKLGQEISPAMAADPAGTVREFPGGGSGYQLPLNEHLTVENFNSIGLGRFSGWTVSFSVKKIGPLEYEVLDTSVIGTLEDLYDFNITSPMPGAQAAMLQIGHGNGSYGRTNGVIYRDTFNIEYTWEGLPQ